MMALSRYAVRIVLWMLTLLMIMMLLVFPVGADGLENAEEAEELEEVLQPSDIQFLLQKVFDVIGWILIGLSVTLTFLSVWGKRNYM